MNKKKIVKLGAALLAVAALVTFGAKVKANTWDVYFSMNDGNDEPFTQTVRCPMNGQHYLIGVNGETHLPRCFEINSGLISDGAVLNVDNVDITHVNNLLNLLNQKAATSSVAAANVQISNLQSDVADLDERLDNVPRIFQTRVQTDSNGRYNWTYPTSTQSGETMIVSGLVEEPASGVMTSLQVVSSTPTGAIVQVNKLQSILGVLTLNVTPGQYWINLTAVQQ